MRTALVLLLILFTHCYADPFDEASRETGIPRQVLVAVAKVESGLHPFAFAVWTKAPIPKLRISCERERFIRGKFLYNECYLKSRKEASDFLSFLLSSPAVLNFSVGLMQINSSWIRVLNVDPYLLLDENMNVLLGALILKHYLELEGDWLKALSRYYGSRRISERYLSKIYKELKTYSN